MPLPEFSLRDKIVLVTGAGSGIGRAAALALAEAGAKVLLADLDLAQARKTAAACPQGIAVHLDVASLTSVEALRDRLVESFGGRLDVLIHCAGQWMDTCPLLSCTEEVWERLLKINLSSHFYLCRTLVPLMIPQGGGAIVFTSSIAGRTGGSGGTIPYATAKGGVNAFMRGLARELAPHHIRVNAIAPGLVDTPLLKRPANRERTAQFADGIPLKRLGQPEEMVGAILLLASPAGSYITGELIEINGGALMN